MASHEPISRQVARVLLLDPQNRVLLFWAQDPADPDQPAFWYLPGGGMRTGESPAQAARRELLEEAGIDHAEIGPVVARVMNVRFRFGGRDFEQDEWHLLARVADERVGPGRPGEEEATSVAAHRWWPLDDLTMSDEIIYPRGLITVLERLLRIGPPDTPWVFTEA